MVRILFSNMGKTLLSMHKGMQKKKPVYQAMRKVYNHYKLFPMTPSTIAPKIAELQRIADIERLKMEERQTQELMPMLQEIQEIQAEASEKMEPIKARAKELGQKHQKEKEDITIHFAEAELALLEGKIAEIPSEIKAYDSTPNIFWRFFDWIFSFIPGYQQHEYADSQEKTV